MENDTFHQTRENPTVVILDSENLAGQDKWLGGALGSDGDIYGVPGTARQILKVSSTTGQVTSFGGPFPGKFKWLRGITVGSDIYCIPSNSDSLLVIHTGENPSASVFSSEHLKGDWLYHGGVLANDGCIYTVPCNATSVLRIEPGSPPRITSFGKLPQTRQKWYGGLLGSDGAVYCIPNNADSVLKISPGVRPETQLFGELEPGGYKWHGGCVGADQRIYGIPAHADNVLCIEPGASPKIYQYGGPLEVGNYRPDGRYKYGGGVLAPNGAVYAFPSDAARVLKILPPDSPEPRVHAVGRAFDDEHNKWQNGFVGRDGNVYGIPLNARGALKIDTATDEAEEVGCFEGREKWEGGVEGPDGALYCMPMRAKRVLKIVPGAPRAGAAASAHK